MPKLLIATGITILSLIIAGCGPQKFGMAADQFDALSPKQQQSVIDSYNERKKIQAITNAANSVIGALGIQSTSKPGYYQPKKTFPIRSHAKSSCHWEGNTRVCKSKSSSSSFSIGVGN